MCFENNAYESKFANQIHLNSTGQAGFFLGGGVENSSEKLSLSCLLDLWIKYLESCLWICTWSTWPFNKDSPVPPGTHLFQTTGMPNSCTKWQVLPTLELTANSLKNSTKFH
jgi:hypothetical protein